MNAPAFVPWEIERALRPERLQAVATEAKNARNRVIDRSVEGLDNPWCLGCQAYAWTCALLTQLAQREDWLRIKQCGLEFTFYVGGIAIKLYRGKSDEPKSNTLRSGVREMFLENRLQFLEDEINQEVEGWFWLLAIDTDIDGRVLETVLFQANAQGEFRYPWAIPLDGRVVAIAPISDVRREGVDQPPASIGVPGDEVRAANDTDVDDES